MLQPQQLRVLVAVRDHGSLSRAAAALGYIGLASEDRIAVSALTGRTARRRASMRGSGRVFRLLDPQAFEAAFRRFMAGFAKANGLELRGVVAVDGKCFVYTLLLRSYTLSFFCGRSW